MDELVLRISANDPMFDTLGRLLRKNRRGGKEVFNFFGIEFTVASADMSLLNGKVSLEFFLASGPYSEYNLKLATLKKQYGVE